MLDALTRLALAGEESARRQLLSRLATAEQPQKRLPIAYRLAQLGEPAGRGTESCASSQKRRVRSSSGSSPVRRTGTRNAWRSISRRAARSQPPAPALSSAVEGLAAAGSCSTSICGPSLSLAPPNDCDKPPPSRSCACRPSTPACCQNRVWPGRRMPCATAAGWCVAGTAVLGDIETDAATGPVRSC